MQSTKIILLALALSLFAQLSFAQTVDHPVVITVSTSANTVSPAHPNYAVIQFKVPQGMWLGAKPGDARTPPATMIVPKEIPGFTFEEPLFPETVEGWVPAKLGRTKVFKETVNVVVPFTVDGSVPKTDYDLTFYITYTPSYTAGKLSTKVKEEYSAKIKVTNTSSEVAMPQPSLEPISSDFIVGPKSYENVPSYLQFMFKPLDEENAFIKGMHKVWLDKEGHGKTVRAMPFPSLSETNITGSSVGFGGSLFNSTREGTMTSMISVSGFYNDLIDGVVGVQAISCPGAYYNYQFSAYFGGESYRDVTFKHENFTVADSKYGYDISFRSLEEPRMRFYGVGNETNERDESAYRQTLLHTGLDLYSVSIQNFRFGAGFSYDDYEVGTSFDKIRTEEEIGFLQDSDLFPTLQGVDGASITGFKVNLIYDRKDQEFTPAKGFYSKLTLARNSVSNTDELGIEDDYYELDLDVRQYFSGPSQKLVGLMRGGLNLKSESNLPFYALSSLGGPNSMRAYDFERFLGKNSAFASAEMRYTLMSAVVLGYPMDIEMAAFVDAGQIFGGEEDFGDDLKVDPGFSVRMINKPNVGLILTYAYGDDGGYFTGGLGLPF